MAEYVGEILKNQFEAALCMLERCIRSCPPEHWEGRIGNDTFRQNAYHTLFFVDLYLSRGEGAFELRELHQRGDDERVNKGPSTGLSQDETLAYLSLCRRKAIETLAAETPASLEGGSGFSWLPFSRGELHLYNLRHVQHHAGQMCAYLRKLGQGVRWAKSGWEAPLP